LERGENLPDPTTTQASEIIRQNHDLAYRIILDMRRHSTDLFFRNLSELYFEVARRIETSLGMIETQEGPVRLAFGYPRRNRLRNYGPRVNIAARDYWEPEVPDNYEIRTSPRPHPRDPDQITGHYSFRLTDPLGRNNAYDAIENLFVPQPGNRRRFRTLIHCDYLTTLIHFRSAMHAMGRDRFNSLVRSNTIPLELRYDGISDVVIDSIRIPRAPRTGLQGVNYRLQMIENVPRHDLLIGDHVIFYNHPFYDFLMDFANTSSVWRLENAILIDSESGLPMHDIFLGHGSERKTEEQMSAALLEHFNRISRLARSRLRRHFNTIQREFPPGFLTRTGNNFYINGPDHGGPSSVICGDSTIQIPPDTQFLIRDIGVEDIPGLYHHGQRDSQLVRKVWRPAESYEEA
jgi:hypothetical protein